MFLLNPAKLNRGDIILTNSASPISERIRRLTKSRFSHAILYMGELSCIDSDGLGVQAQNIQRKLFDSTENVVVLRLIDNPDEEAIIRILYFARQKVGTEYSSLDEAKMAVTHTTESSKEPNRQFCSRFVAQAYQQSGITLVDNPDYCLPEDILNSPLLQQVEEPLYEANPQEVAFASETETPLTNQTRILNGIFNAARDLTGEDIQSFEQLSQYVIDHPDKDQACTDIVRSSGYLEMWRGDIERNPWHYDITECTAHYSNPNALYDFATSLLKIEEGVRERLILNLTFCNTAFQQTSLEYFKTHIALYQKLVDLSLQREEVAKMALMLCE